MKLLKNLMSMKEDALHKVLHNYLRKKYKKVIIYDDFLIAEGDIPIGLVAHLDTVHKNLPTHFFYDQKENVLWSPQGLGADDRAGVYAIIKIIESGYRPHIIFCKKEEVGGKGAQALIEKFSDCPFKYLKFLIELDRSGKNDCVFYECSNEDFTKFIESFGFKEDLGSFSDISIIAPAWRVAAVNLSIGYYFEHSKAEFLKIKELERTIEKVKNILNDEKNTLYYEYVPKIYYNFKDSNCIFCNSFIKKGEGFSFYDFNFSYYDCCQECYAKYF